MAWWGWVLVGWTGLSVVLALVLGRAIRVADAREVDLDAPSAAAVPGRARRRIPVPLIAVPLAGLGVTLEAVGFVLRSAGLDEGLARHWSMDDPQAVPRMFVTGLFVAAAVFSFLGGSRAPGRRAWWVGVGLVAAVVAQVKGGGTVHVEVLDALGVGGRPGLAALGSAAVAAVVLAVLWWLSRSEVRDRRRVLGAFALYAVASVGLSAVSSVAGQSRGAAWAAVATFVEESGEVVGAVAVLMAVLVGVAPRLVLPADWPLRRTEDASTVDAPGQLPVWTPSPDRPRF